MNVLELSSYIFSAMVSWVPLTDHSFLNESVETTAARYHSIANTIAEVSISEPPLFAGADAEVKTALILGSIASSESFFRADVDSCKKGGDNGLAWGDWQTHAPKKLVCSSRVAAAKIALQMIRNSFNVCKNYKLVDQLSVYTDGSCKADWWRSRYKMNRAINYLKKNPFIQEL